MKNLKVIALLAGALAGCGGANGINEENLIRLQIEAVKGDTEVQYRLGILYEHGVGVKQDHVAAESWYRLAAEQGFAEAQFRLGLLHLNEYRPLSDAVYGRMWVNVAAANGSESALEAREMIKRTLTREQIAEAQRLARECIRKNHKDC